MQIKTHKNDTYSIKGLDIEHLEVLYSLLNRVRLDTERYPSKAADLTILLEKFVLEKFGVVPMCNLEVTGVEITIS